MNFSLVLPSRERLALLEGLLQSVLLTTNNLDQVEVWVAFDWDDAASTGAVRRLSRAYPFCQFVVTDRQSNLAAGYYNKLAHLSGGRYVMVLNDDCVLTTKGWDDLCLAALEDYRRLKPDGVLYGKTEDDFRAEYACFPLLSRETLEAVGWFFHPEMTAWGADIHLYRMFKQLARVVPLPCAVEHLSYHTGKRPRDAVNRRVQQISRYNYASADGEARRLQRRLAEN